MTNRTPVYLAKLALSDAATVAVSLLGITRPQT